MIWLLNRMAVPLLLAGIFVATRWGCDNVVFYVMIPPLILVWRMAISESQTTSNDRSRVRGWYRGHVAEIFSFIFLTAFEVAVAVMAEAKIENAWCWSVIFVALFLPYALLLSVMRHALQNVETDS